MVSNLQIILSSCLLLAANGFFMNPNRGQRTCPDPALENGQHDSMESAWLHWTHPLFKTLNFFCDEGYQLRGPRNATCQMDGTWTKLPKCVEMSSRIAKTKSICDLPSIAYNVKVYPHKPAYDLKETVYFVCQQPRKSDQIFMTSCNADGQFNPALPKCVEPRCPPPEVPRNGGLRSPQLSYAVGEIAHFKCFSGYTLAGNATATCGEDGHFSNTKTRCLVRGSCSGRCGDVGTSSFCSCHPSCLYDRTGTMKCCHDFVQCLNGFNWNDWFNFN